MQPISISSNNYQTYQTPLHLETNTKKLKSTVLKVILYVGVAITTIPYLGLIPDVIFSFYLKRRVDNFTKKLLDTGANKTELSKEIEVLKLYKLYRIAGIVREIIATAFFLTGFRGALFIGIKEMITATAIFTGIHAFFTGAGIYTFCQVRNLTKTLEDLQNKCPEGCLVKTI